MTFSGHDDSTINIVLGLLLLLLLSMRSSAVARQRVMNTSSTHDNNVNKRSAKSAKNFFCLNRRVFANNVNYPIFIKIVILVTLQGSVRYI